METDNIIMQLRQYKVNDYFSLDTSFYYKRTTTQTSYCKTNNTFD